MYKRIFLFFSLALFLLSAAVFCRLFAQKSSAEPQNVRGSSNVAVCGYTNSCGSFIVWSDGRISTVKGEVVNEASQYGAAAGYKLPARVNGHCLGSKNVAVAAFVNAEGSYVVFADGSVKCPKNSSAGAGSSSARLISGRIFGEGGAVQASQEVAGYGGRFTRTFLSSGNNGRKVRIVFSEPFGKIPLIFVSYESSSLSGKGSAPSYTVSEISRDGFTFSYQGSTSVIGTTGISNYIFMASGE